MISVIVPAYNSEKTLTPCLEAIRGSSFQDYELIVVDDGSTDATPAIAEKYADRVISNKTNRGPGAARNVGVDAAKGEVFAFIDSDVVVRADSLRTIAAHFSDHPDVHALTGLLAREHPNPDFFSQYKNLYMNYIFSKLPDRVNFLYGSVCAVRASAFLPFRWDFPRGQDTELGRRLAAQGKHIAFLRDLEVVHPKKYSFTSWVVNDFRIAHAWASIFITSRGGTQAGQSRGGFAHSPVEQLMSVVLAPTTLLLFMVRWAFSIWQLLPSVGALLWLALNIRFASFLSKERGLRFGAFALVITALDHCVMALGIFTGLLGSVLTVSRRSAPRMM